MFQKRNTLLAAAAMILPALMASTTQAAPITVKATILADNGSLAVLEQTPGNFAVIPNSVSGQWPNQKTFSFIIDNDARTMRTCKIHVIAWGDGSIAQGMLAHFNGTGGSVYTGQAGGPFTVAMSSVMHSGGTAAGQNYANNNANAANIISNLGTPSNSFVSQPAVTGGIPGTWGPVALPDVPGRADVRFLWNSQSNALNANPNNYRVISTPCDRVVRPEEPKPLEHIASWEIAGQFNSSNATASSSSPFASQFEVWTYGYTVNPDCSGPLIPFANRSSSNNFVGRPTDMLSKGPNAMTSAADNPSIGQTLGTTSLSPLKFSPSGLTMHPGQANECAVVRFTAPQAGRYRWMGRFWAQNTTAGGTNSGTKVVVNSNPSHPANDATVNVFGDPATGSPSNNPFASPASGVNLAQGQTIDFMVGSNGSFYNDSTGLHGYIQRDE